MHTKNIEFLSAICSFAAWVIYVFLSDKQDLHYSIPAIIAMAVTQFYSQEKGGVPSFIPSEYTPLSVGYVTLPLMLLFCCLYWYRDINDAYWIFIAFSCSLGASLGAYFHIILRGET